MHATDCAARMRQSFALLRPKFLPRIESDTGQSLAICGSGGLRGRNQVFSAESGPVDDRAVRGRSALTPCADAPDEVLPVALSEIDRSLLDRCLNRKPRAWEDFVDRFMGLVVHVINHTAQCRSINLSAADREDLAAEVFLAIVDNDLAVLRHFRGQELAGHVSDGRGPPRRGPQAGRRPLGGAAGRHGRPGRGGRG